MADEEVITWSHDMEVRLFLSMRWNQPVGVNRHFHMLFLQERLSRAAGKWISFKQIWKHLHTLYNLEALEEIERTRFEDEASDFTLPKEYFDDKANQSDTAVGTATGPATPSGSTKGRKEEVADKSSDVKRDKLA